MPGNLEDDVLQFVAEFTGVRRDRLSLASTLMGDLGVAGDDGVHLLEQFGKRFQVDLFLCLPERHFGPEEPASPLSILRWLVGFLAGDCHKTPEERAELMPIHISDLVVSAGEGRWSLTPGPSSEPEQYHAQVGE